MNINEINDKIRDNNVQLITLRKWKSVRLQDISWNSLRLEFDFKEWSLLQDFINDLEKNKTRWGKNFKNKISGILKDLQNSLI